MVLPNALSRKGFSLPDLETPPLPRYLGLLLDHTPAGSMEVKDSARERQGPEPPGFREGGNTPSAISEKWHFPS